MHILSGDRADAVRPVAEALGIAKWLADLKPAEKIAFIEALKRQGHRVLMVGDGLNDAPALAAAHVSLSPIAAADVTQAQADAVFLGERLEPVLDALVVARRARALMKENLWFAAIYNMIAVPVAIAGAITPLIAALAMSGSSLMVTLNALRAQPARPDERAGLSRPAGARPRPHRPGRASCGRCAAGNTATSTAPRCACCRTTTSSRRRVSRVERSSTSVTVSKSAGSTISSTSQSSE